MSAPSTRTKTPTPPHTTSLGGFSTAQQQQASRDAIQNPNAFPQIVTGLDTITPYLLIGGFILLLLVVH